MPGGVEMRRPRLFAGLVVASLVLATAPSVASDYLVKGLRIGHPWTRPAAAGTTAVGYLTITNRSARADVLKAVETTVATSASVHTTTMTGSVMSMRPRKGGLLITPGKTVTLSPGGDHIMMAGLNRTLVLGGSVPAVLVFERAGRVPVEFAVEANPPPPPPPKPKLTLLPKLGR